MRAAVAGEARTLPIGITLTRRTWWCWAEAAWRW